MDDFDAALGSSKSSYADPSDSSRTEPVRIERTAEGWHLRASIWLPRPIDEIFPFFADARNLERITPPFLRFQVTTPEPIEMRVGAVIDYKLKVRGLPLRWRSRITHWAPGVAFTDEQVKGPYKVWRHTHTFESVEGGTRAGDIVEYAVPGGPIAHALFVRRDVKAIFEYRSKRLLEIFGG